MKTVAIIQARMGSSRLPGKVLLPLAGKPLLWHIIYRLRKCRTVDEIAVATSSAPDDDAIEAFAIAEGVRVVRGPEDDVLARYVLAAEATNADIIVRVTGDAPLIDPEMIDNLVETLIAENAEYCTGLPGVPVIHEGFCPMTRRALQRLSAKAGDDPMAREHVTAYFKEHVDFARTVYVDMDSDYRFEGARLSVDTPADLTFMEIVYDRLKAPAGEADAKDVVKLLRAEPELLEINAHVHQKRPDEKSLRVIIRSDGDAEIGIGHIKRCLALADQLRDVHGCGVTFAVARGAEGLELVKSAQYPIARRTGKSEDTWLNELVEQIKPDAFVLDVRSELSPETVRRWKDKGVVIATLDDLSDRRLAADLAFYPPIPQVRKLDWLGFTGQLYVGWEWVALGQNLAENSHREIRERPMVLVTMGGSDPAGLTLKAVEALDRLNENFDTQVILGPGFSGHEQLSKILSTATRRYDVYNDVEDMTALMGQSDLALASFGVTAYELAAMGVPAALVCLTDDHSESASIFADAGIALNLGRYDRVTDETLRKSVLSLLKDSSLREQMSTKGRLLVDSRAAARIAKLIGSTKVSMLYCRNRGLEAGFEKKC